MPFTDVTAKTDDANRARQRGTYSRTSEDKVNELRKWSHRDIEFWSMRNTRFQKDQELYRLVKPDNLGSRNEADIAILNDPRILVRKTARLIARHPNIIEVPASPNVKDTSIAQRVENFLYQWDQALNQKWMAGLNNPYRYDQAFSCVLRGWITERTMFYPEGAMEMQNDPAAMWDHQVIDPALVYPYTSGNQIIRVTHSYRTTIGELRYDPIIYGQGTPQWMEDVADTAIVNCNAIYWRDADRTWWHAVLASSSGSAGSLDTEYLKEPTELGYNPWTILTANGASYRGTPWDWDQYIDQIGTGILDDASDTYRYMNRMATKLNELLSLEANPPAALYTADGQIKQIDLQPGGRNFLTSQNDKIELLRTGPRVDSYQLLWDIFQKRADRAGLPGAFFAEYGGDSPFSSAVLMAAGKDILFPFTEAVNQADALKYRKVLEIYRDFGPAMPLPTFLEQGDGKTVTSATIDEFDIRQQGTFVKITREDMTPQELASRINLGLAMLARQAISLETFRRDWAKVENPKAENRQVLAEMVYMNQDVIKQLIPVALAETGQDKMVALWQMLQNGPVPGQPPQGDALGPPQGQQPGQPPGPPGGDIMSQVMQNGLPSQTLAPQNAAMPPQMQNQQDPQMALQALLSQLQGGALGGAGAGGTPPPPGSVGFVPQMSPFFRPGVR